MTKKYNAFPISDGYVVVEEEREAYPLAYHIKKKEILEIKGVGGVSGELFHEKGFTFKDECYKVLATIAPKRTGSLPMIEIPNTIDYSLNDLAYSTMKIDVETSNNFDLGSIKGFCLGYKAATKTYTEQDLAKAFDAGRQSKGYTKNLVSRGFQYEYPYDYIDKLKAPKPIIVVELELSEATARYDDGDILPVGDFFPKVDESNIIHPVNIFYGN